MNTKRTLLGTILAAAASVTLNAAVPEVTGVTMTQADDRLVTITYALSDAPAVVTLDIQTNANDGATWASIGGEGIWNAEGDVWKRVETGSHTITWHPDHSWPDHKIADGGARAVVTAWALENTPDYMVVDLVVSNTVRYYPGVDFLPGSEMGQKGAVTNNTAYKTTKLVMRKIMARGIEWTMGTAESEPLRNADGREEPHLVTLTNNYYIGIFEITQAQWKNISPNSGLTAFFQVQGEMRPMDNVRYNEVRLGKGVSTDVTTVANAIANYSWPKPPHPSSFLGFLRGKTGLDFDLPSESQWEFAARAGHGSGFWGDGSVVESSSPYENMNKLGRHSGNNPGGATANSAFAPLEGGTAIVGSYKPNDWGLYDVNGNVYEWCLDWSDLTSKVTEYEGKVNIDPESPGKDLAGNQNDAVVTTSRSRRGGAWSHAVSNCRNGARSGTRPEYNGGDAYRVNGVRVVCTAGLR